ncbi:MAG: hypothetical protein CL678_02885 [Bdellovibrionaceae bacterium]|nr:hypothetical protein [Pseudobdellovibrionaceae bacterium]|tara:strand:+ start:2861 stop:3832 length:972 start_codon:yes stop_codon:yes gene_type:complete
MSSFIFLCVTLFSTFCYSHPIDTIESQLKSEGVSGWIHGSNTSQGLYVFTWRDPKNFFQHFEFPLITKSPQTLELIKSLQRHDKVKVKGAFLKYPAFKHIQVETISILKKHEESFSLPKKILEGSSLIGKVHAIVSYPIKKNFGAIVIEYGNYTLPAFTSAPEEIKNLYRNDKIKINYRVIQRKNAPPHLKILTQPGKPGIEILENIVDQHQKNLTLEGTLALFPKSPQIKFDIYALKVVDSDGISRNYTLVGKTNELFFEIKDYLESIWNEKSEYANESRNHYNNPFIQLKVKGTTNIISPNQANPQIFIDNLKDIVVSIKK